MTLHRRSAVVGAFVLAGVSGLTACEEPAPLATVTVGTNSVHAEPNSGCYNHGNRLPDSALATCLQGKPTSIDFPAGDRLRFGVDPKVADKGWFLAVDGQSVIEPVMNTYRSFPGDLFFTNPTTGQSVNQVRVSLVEGSPLGDTRGLWSFEIHRTDD